MTPPEDHEELFPGHCICYTLTLIFQALTRTVSKKFSSLQDSIKAETKQDIFFLYPKNAMNGKLSKLCQLRYKPQLDLLVHSKSLLILYPHNLSAFFLARLYSFMSNTNMQKHIYQEPSIPKVGGDSEISQPQYQPGSHSDQLQAQSRQSIQQSQEQLITPRYNPNTITLDA